MATQKKKATVVAKNHVSKKPSVKKADSCHKKGGAQRKFFK